MTHGPNGIPIVGQKSREAEMRVQRVNRAVPAFLAMFATYHPQAQEALELVGKLSVEILLQAGVALDDYKAFLTEVHGYAQEEMKRQAEKVQ